MKFEQIFYGNTGNGYRILAASDMKLADKAAEICRAVGTPDGLAEFSQFLISVPVGDRLFVACCRPGGSDDAKRPTLFFHVLVGDRKTASREGTDAFSLADAGRFAGALPLGGATTLTVEPSENPASREAPTWDGAPTALPRRRPANDELRKMLGSRVNAAAWASFSFRRLGAPFELYAVSEYAPTAARTPSADTPASKDTPAPGKRASGTVLKIALLLSLLANAWCVLAPSSRNDAPQPPPGRGAEVEAETRIAAAREDGRKAGYEQAFAELKAKFPKNSRYTESETQEMMRRNRRERDYVLFVHSILDHNQNSKGERE